MLKKKAILIVDLDYLNSLLIKSQGKILPFNAETVVNDFVQELSSSLFDIDAKHLIYTVTGETEELDNIEAWNNFKIHKNISKGSYYRCSKCNSNEKIKATAEKVTGKLTVLSPATVSFLTEIITFKFGTRLSKHSYLVLLGRAKDYDSVLRIARKRQGKICILGGKQEKHNGNDMFLELANTFDVKEFPANNEELKETVFPASHNSIVEKPESGLKRCKVVPYQLPKLDAPNSGLPANLLRSNNDAVEFEIPKGMLNSIVFKNQTENTPNPNNLNRRAIVQLNKELPKEEKIVFKPRRQENSKSSIQDGTTVRDRLLVDDKCCQCIERIDVEPFLVLKCNHRAHCDCLLGEEAGEICYLCEQEISTEEKMKAYHMIITFNNTTQ